MKKIKYILPIIVLLIMTGCFSPKVQLEKAILKMKNMENTSIDITANLSVPVLTSSVNMDVNVKGDMVNLNDKDKVKTHLNTTMNFLINVSSESYTYIKDDYLYTYTKSNDEWSYTKKKIEEDRNINVSKEDIINLLETFKDVKKVDSDKKGYTKLLVTLNKDSLNDLLKKYANKELSSKINLTNDIEVGIHLKDGYISIIDMDLSNVLSDNVKAHVTISFSNINKVKDFDIPKEVIDTAKENKEEN